MNRTRLPAVLALTAISAAAQAQTATDPGAVLREQQETLRYYELQKRLQERPPAEPQIQDETPKPKDKGAGESEVRIAVEKIRIGTSRFLKPDEISAITKTLEGREVSIKELFDAVRALNGLYRDRGCVTCQAFLPQQKVDGGVVEIRLVEGRLGEIRVEGGRYIRDGYILSRITPKPGEVLDTKKLEQDLAFLNNTNEFRVAAALKPGKEFGVVDATILSREPNRFYGTLFSDNAGRDDVGRIRVGALLGIRSVLGYGDPLTISLIGAEGTKGGSLAYSFPFTRYGTRVGLNYDYSTIKIIDGPFERANVEGTSSNVGVSLVQPLVADGIWRWNATAGYNTRDSITTLGGIGSEALRRDTRSFFLGTDFQRATSNGFWSMRHTITLGTTNFGGDREFRKYTLDGLWVNNYASGWSLLLRGAGQVVNTHDLPSYEQFFIGGSASVRGFTEGQRGGNRGYLLSAETQFPLLTGADSPIPGDRLKGLAFLDHGGAFPTKPVGLGPNSDDYLTSVGTGLLANFNRYLSGRLTLGIPCDTHGPNYRQWIFHAYLQAAVF